MVLSERLFLHYSALDPIKKKILASLLGIEDKNFRKNINAIIIFLWEDR